MMTRQLTLLPVLATLAVPALVAQATERAQTVQIAGVQLPVPASGALTKPAKLAVRGLPLADALALLAERARVPIAYSASLLPSPSRVDCPCQAATVAEALERLLAGTTLDFDEVHGQIVIFPRPALTVPSVHLVAVPEWAEAGDTRSEAAPGGVLSAPIRWQAPGVIRGRVVEMGTERSLSGALVSIPGTRLGAVSDAAGRYAIQSVPAGTHRIVVRFIGFGTAEQSVTVGEGETVEANFALATAPIALDELVVTGAAGPVSRRSLGNSVTTINTPDIIEKVVNTNVTELLQGKAPGVTVLQSSGTPGAASNIRIRGVTSLSGSSEAVVYVDGIRVSSAAGGAFRNNWETPNPGQVAGGGQTASALDAINPEDIESIEVIKGPAAATLYGADAANGVIQIITKRGRAGYQKLQWNARAQFGQTAWGLDRRASRTTCDAVRIADPVTWPGCQGVAAGTVLTESFLDPTLRDGAMGNSSLSVRGGGLGYSFFVGIDRDREEGIFPNSLTGRTGTRANFAFFPSDRVDFAVNLAYSRSETAFPAADNGPNIIEAAWTYQPGRAPLPGQTYGFAGGTASQYSQYDNRLQGDRVVVGTTLNYRPLHWFRHRLTVGGDIGSRQANRYAPVGGLFAPVAGQMTQGAPVSNVYTVDYAGNIDHRLPLGTGLPSVLTIGAQYIHNKYQNTIAQGTGWDSTVGTLVQTVATSSTRNSWDEFREEKSLGFFAQEQVAWRDRLYLTGALRIDNNSALGDRINSIYYPKLSASYVISEEPFFHPPTWLDELRLRLAWGEAGNAPPRNANISIYTPTQVVDPRTGQIVTGVRQLTLGNPNIKPERGSEIETGFDAAVLGGILGVEFTFYNKTTSDAVMPVPLPPSLCGTACVQFQNLGEINNRGIELSLLTTPIRSQVVTWESRLGLSSNRNRLVNFGYNVDTIFLGVTTLNQRHVEGYPLAGFWVHDPVYDTAQAKYVASPARFLGPSMPTRELAFSNTLTVRGNLRLFTLLDYKGGHYLLNQTDWRRCVAAICEEVNDPNVSATRKAQLMADLGANDALYTQRADFIKVREVSLTYTLPAAWANRLRSDRIAVTLAAHNLGYLWKPYPGLDPEVTFNGINQPDTPGDGQTFGWVRMDYWTVPMLRRFTMSVDWSF